MISISLGLGTMIGWKRIVKTIGEKIGKQHMSYAQGASAEIVAAIGIGVATAYKATVSTTHMLSSGIMGSMVAKKGLKNLQRSTITNILLAWVLTLPVTIILSGGLFLLFRAIL
jgi:PiT family inorganic phosphate transporter